MAHMHARTTVAALAIFVIQGSTGRALGNRVLETYGTPFTFDDSVPDTVVARCKEVESGARNVDHIINRTLLPAVAAELLARQAEGRGVSAVRIGVRDTGQFTYVIE